MEIAVLVSLSRPAAAIEHRCGGQFASVLSRRTGALRWIAPLDRHSIAFASQRRSQAKAVGPSALRRLLQFTEQTAGAAGNRQGSVRLRKNFSTAATE